MHRTPAQEKLEVQRGKAIPELLRESLANHTGQKQLVTLAALDLGITGGTFYQWCREHQIDLDPYRSADTAPTAETTAAAP